MPLTFLTADRAFDGRDDLADGAALPYEDLNRWRRPYRPGPWRVGAAALVLLLASYLLFAAVIVAFAGALPGAGVCVGAAAVVIVCALRLLRVGVWVSAQGLRRTGFFGTTTLPWARVAAVRTVQQPVKWLGTPRTVQGQALLVIPVDGEPLRPLITDHNADFLARVEAFDMAADAVEGWAAEYGC
ncbi:PH domain-containing protein [Streptomyces sp. NPDC004647]|uniref:PH domain-containing protein n=1 Tax=Streptomyces sp. NPDC004647 TaxID=3154671 RepID=UPI00339DD7FE